MEPEADHPIARLPVPLRLTCRPPGRRRQRGHPPHPRARRSALRPGAGAGQP
ncbi:hypothetical protein A3768_0045 [Ralstonia solanacearum]|nr:hypothetical protein F504_3450 [Ralstonia pseudosolanacearum FQY_4]ANH31238.1 hypothetical protein A3768_0045 [Ralstonia solanacearum]